jgi:hypothetical protein
LYFGLIILEDHYKNLVNDKCPIAMKKLNSLNHLSAKMKRTNRKSFGIKGRIKKIGGKNLKLTLKK